MGKKLKTKLTPIYIKWTDSCSHHGWGGSTSELGFIESFALLVAESKDSVTIATSYDRTGEIWADRMVIPRVAIMECRKLKGISK